jgi:hypothetical protein
MGTGRAIGRVALEDTLQWLQKARSECHPNVAVLIEAHTNPDGQLVHSMTSKPPKCALIHQVC